MIYTIGSRTGEKIFDYTGDVLHVILEPGKYKFEVWGAEGGAETGGTTVNGKGGYSYGIKEIRSKKEFYIYIGEKGKCCGSNSCPSTYNGGGSSGAGAYPHSGGCSGGGATDIRLKNGTSWSDENSLKTRILVAGGGGGANGAKSVSSDNGGYGGGIEGGPSVGGFKIFPGGTQINGYAQGIGQNGRSGTKVNGGYDGNGGGGGGWFGGCTGTGTGQNTSGGGGGGSGHVESSYFIESETIPGNTTIPSPNGVAKISWIFPPANCNEKLTFNFFSFEIFTTIFILK